MSSLYKNNYIESYNEEILLNILNGKTPYTPNPNNLRERCTYITLQHYLIKYIEENGKSKITNKLLTKYYEDFINNPHLFVDSPIIRNGFLNRFVSKKLREKLIEHRNIYYNPLEIKKIYIKLTKNKELTIQESNRLYALLIYEIKRKNDKYNIVINECIKRILNSNKNIRQLSEMELKFYCTYIAQHAGENAVYPDVHIIKTKSDLNGFENKNIIYINKNSDYAKELFLMTKTTCHEVRHAVQEKESRNSNTKAGFEMAIYNLLFKYLQSKNYDTRQLNYYYSGIEINADDFGFYKAGILLKTLGREDLRRKLFEIEQNEHSQRHLYEFMVDKNYLPKSTDAYIVENIDKIIKAHPEELEEYRVLKNFYNNDGTRKTLGNLLAHRMNQKFEDRGLYDNYINYEIAKNKLFHIDLVHTKPEINRKLFETLKEIYENKIQLFNNYCADKDYNHLKPSQIKATTLYQIKIMDNILTFIEQNIDYVLASKEEKQISKNSFIYGFILGLRDFNLNNINNDVIKNNPIIQERIKSLFEKHNYIVNKFNEEYIKNRIEDLSIEEKHELIVTPDGNNMQLQDFLYYEVLPKLDAHSEVLINGHKVHVSNVIKICKAQLNDKNNTNQSIK